MRQQVMVIIIVRNVLTIVKEGNTAKQQQHSSECYDYQVVFLLQGKKIHRFIQQKIGATCGPYFLVYWVVVGVFFFVHTLFRR